jgi:acetoacetyl-CoA synthetase
MTMGEEARKLWEPGDDFIQNSNLTAYMTWLRNSKGKSFNNYDSLWQWSVNHEEDFWESLWEYFSIIGTSYQGVISKDSMPDTRWFEGATLNFAQHIFRQSTSTRPALIYKRENSAKKEMSWAELTSRTAKLQDFLKTAGLEAGDRVVAYLPNIPEATISFLATNAMGGIWSSCSPDFGVSAVIDRFAQVEPKVLICVDGYTYGGKPFDKKEALSEIIHGLPTLEKVILIPYLHENSVWENTYSWDSIMAGKDKDLSFLEVPFEHPIWILYSSGTTGIPKAITHSHGGVLLELLKYLTFHNDVHEGDRSFWYTTTGWMMWNYLQGALLCGATIVLYDGSPAFPDIDGLWKLAEECRITHLGTSAGYITACMKENSDPKNRYDLSSLVSIGSTGSPLPPEGFGWVYKHIHPDVWLTSISGGTDVCSAFVGGNPLWPVYQGEIQCRALGCSLEAYNEDGLPVYNEVGEMVITKPMPSMPVFFWNDEEKKRYRSSYFEEYPGVWRHGDWIRISPRKGVVIYGRSDATLNRGGVRIGTSEVYRAVDKIEEVADSLIICLEKEKGDFYMPLYVQMKPGYSLSPQLIEKINRKIRADNTPRHVPDEIIEIGEVPYTISGKKTESPVKKILMGIPIEKAIKKDALRNPTALDFFVKLAPTLKNHT